jgi:hypothetical protein
MSSVETAHGHTDHDDTQVFFGTLLYFIPIAKQLKADSHRTL